jgi:hypothetical protein
MKTSAEHAIQGGVVRLTLPAKLAFDLGALRESLRDLAERLGHAGCATGCDVLHIGMEREFTVNQERKLAAHGLSSHDEVMAPGFPGPWKTPVTVTIPERVSGNIESLQRAVELAVSKLGCAPCSSGFDVLFRHELDLIAIDEKLGVHGFGQYR